jgi:NADH-quinone oxidoreductase subunit C
MNDVDKHKILVDLGEIISAELEGIVTHWEISFGELNITLQMQGIVDAMRFMRDDKRTNFISFVDLCGVDYPERDQRFDVVYHLMSPTNNTRVRLRVHTDETTPVPSITGIYPGAGWFEREAYDMYGILFTGHPDLRRLLTDYGFDGYPLRKDFPLTGNVETRYDDELKRVVYEPVELRQEFRDFDFLSPWEGSQYGLPNEDVGSDKGGE